MNDNSKKFGILATVGFLVLLVIALFLFFGFLNRTDEPAPAANNAAVTATPTPPAGIADESYIRYDLPEGWAEQRCEAHSGTVFLLPPEITGFDCETNRSAPITIGKDSDNIKDCEQLENQPDTGSHSCTKVSIDGHDTVYQTTTYVKSREFPYNTTVSAYYVSTDKGVVAITYSYIGNAAYHAEFKKLVESAKVKN